MEATCETCRFFADGKCRRNPPERVGAVQSALINWLYLFRDTPDLTLADLAASPLVPGDTDYSLLHSSEFGVWPTVGDNDWCGEHQPRETEPTPPGPSPPSS